MKSQEPKTPYWFSEDEFSLLYEILRHESFEDAKYDGIREELGVAKTRAKTSRISTYSLIVALGLTQGSIPIHLSDKEIKLISGIENLPPELKAKLL